MARDEAGAKQTDHGRSSFFEGLIMRRLLICTGLVVGSAVLAWQTPRAHAYVEAAMSLGSVLAQSSNVVLMRVESVDRDKNLIIYRKIQDIKGKHPLEVIKHNIGRGGLRPNEWK